MYLLMMNKDENRFLLVRLSHALRDIVGYHYDACPWDGGSKTGTAVER